MIKPALFLFLEELKANNSREWFAENKKRYEAEVREPLLSFVEAFAPYLETISPYFLALSTKSGGSMFRIHRDVRFSKDKTPYKTNAALHFRHENGKDAHTPGFYLSLSPQECFCGGGIWRPDSATLRAIREAIVKDPQRWEEVSRGPDLTLAGESLKRPPRGFDAKDPWLEDLKRKDHVAVIKLTSQEVTAKGFLERYVESCQKLAPYVEFLTRAVGQPF